MKTNKIINLLHDLQKSFNNKVDIEWTEENLSQEQWTYLEWYNKALIDIRDWLYAEQRKTLEK